MKTYRTLLKTELKMSLRQMDMLIFAVFMPLVILIILGIIYGTKPAFDGAEYTFMEQSFGALTSIAICAGGVMGLPLVISDYRAKKILKRYQVTPIRPSLILFVEVSMYVVYSVISLVTLSIVAAVFFKVKFRGNIIEFLLGWFIVMVSIFSIGVMVGGLAKDSKSAGVIASILYFPMLIFSGATLPYEVMPKMMQKVVNVFPLTQGIKILKNTSLGLPVDATLASLIILVVIALACMFVGIKYFKWE